MAQKYDSDSDEYEVMVPPNSIAAPSDVEQSVIEAKTASEILEISKTFTPQADKEKKSKVWSYKF